MTELKKAIENYTQAVMAHAEMQNEDVIMKDKLRKSRHAVVIARETMKALEREVMEDGLRDLKPL